MYGERQWHDMTPQKYGKFSHFYKYFRGIMVRKTGSVWFDEAF